MSRLDLARYCVGRTFLGAERTASAFVGVNRIAEKIGTAPCRAFLLFYMSLIFVSEILDSSQNRVGSSLTETAECAVLDGIAKLLKQLDIALFAQLSEEEERLKKL